MIFRQINGIYLNLKIYDPVNQCQLDQQNTFRKNNMGISDLKNEIAVN